MKSNETLCNPMEIYVTSCVLWYLSNMVNPICPLVKSFPRESKESTESVKCGSMTAAFGHRALDMEPVAGQRVSLAKLAGEGSTSLDAK